jgi:hypothetical protein
MPKSTFIHVGFPKCASTALQEDFFIKCPEIEYLGRTRAHQGQGKHKYLMQLATLDNLHYSMHKREIIDNIKATFSGDKGKVQVLSDELLVSTYRPYISGIPVADCKSIAERLHDIFPEAHIVMIIRNQLSFYGSMLGQLMRNNTISIDVDKFFKSHRRYAAKDCGSFFLLMDYHAVYSMYESIFGKGHVHVMLFEDFVKSPPNFVKRFVELIGLSDKTDADDYVPVQHNPRATHFEIWCKTHQKLLSVLRSMSPRFVRKLIAKIFKTSQIRPTLSPEQMGFLSGLYSPGNRELASVTGLDLAAAGYPLESEGTARN